MDGPSGSWLLGFELPYNALVVEVDTPVWIIGQPEFVPSRGK